MTRAHQPGQAAFRSILAEDIDWQPFPAFPLAARLPVVVGEPSEPGPYVVRVKVPSSVNSCRTSTRRTASTRSCPASSTTSAGARAGEDS